MGLFSWLKKKKTPAPAPISSPVPTSSYNKPIPLKERTGTIGETPKPVALKDRTGTSRRRSSGGSSSYTKPIPLKERTGTIGETPKPVALKDRTGTSRRLSSSGEPSQYDITSGGKVIPKSDFDAPSQIQAADYTKTTRTQFQAENMAAATTIPRFGTSDRAFVTKGEVQTERELQRFGIQQQYKKDIQSQFAGSGLSVEDFMVSEQFVKTTRAAENKFTAIPDVEGLYAEPDLRSGAKRIIQSVVPTENIKEFVKSEVGWIGAKKTAAKEKEERTAEESIGLYEKIYEGRDTRAEKAQAGLIDIGIIGATVVPIAGIGVDIGRASLSKNLAKQLSVGMESLGTSPVKFGGVTDTTRGIYSQGFTQSSGSFGRIGQITGKTLNLGEGLSLIPEGSGVAVSFGEARLTGGKRIAAKILGVETERGIVQAQTFDIAGVSQIIPTSEIAGFEAGRSFGLGTFTPKTTYTSTFGRKDLIGAVDVDVRTGGSIISSESQVGVFTKRLPKYDLSFIEGKDTSGLMISTDIKQFTPKIKVTSFAKDKVKSSVSKDKFLEGLKITETKPITPEIKIPSKSGLITETKPVVKLETKQLSQTLQTGLRGSAAQVSKPFSFRMPSFTSGVTKSLGALGTATLAKVGLSQTSVQGFGGITSQSFVQGSVQGLKSGTISETKAETATPTSFITPTITTPGFGGITSPTPRIPLIPLPLPKPSFGRPGGVGTFSAERIFKYSPSFTAVSFGTTATKQSKGVVIGGREVFTGFEERAIVKKKKSSKKKKKKK